MTAWLAIIAPAWIAGSILALLSAPLGCLVLWRRMAFFADALAHGTLLGVALAVLWQLPMGIGIGIVSILVVLGLVFIDDERLPVDAVLAVVAVSLLCLGLLTLTQLTDQQANVLGFLFGNLLELDWADLPLIAVSVLVGLGLLIYIWPAQIKLATHEALARIQGINPMRQRLFFMGVLAGFCAIALQAVGSFINQRAIGVASINSAFMVGLTKTNGCYLFNHCPARRYAWRLGKYLARYPNGACYRFGTGYFIFCGAHYLKANKQKIRVRIHISKILVPTPLALFTCSTKLPRTSAMTFRS